MERENVTAVNSEKPQNSPSGSELISTR